MNTTRLDETRVDITDKDIKKALRRPSDFGWFGDEEMFVTWALGPVIEHRDSDVLDRANAKALRIYLDKDLSLADDWKITSCNHWAVGWVNHISYRAVEADGTPTRIFRLLMAWWKALDVYPVADDDLYSEMEHEEANQIWKDCYSPEKRIEYIRKYRSQFEFHTFADMLGCVRGKYFAGYANELVNR